MALEILNWREHANLLAAPVRAALETLPAGDIIGVTENTDEESDTDLWCPAYDIPFSITGNVVVVHTHKTRKAPPEFAAALVTANLRADLNGVVKHTLGVSKVSFAPIDAAVEATGMESGGMSPVGLPADWPILVDASIRDLPHLYVGSGIRPSKLVVSGHIFDALIAQGRPVQWVEGLGTVRANLPENLS